MQNCSNQPNPFHSATIIRYTIPAFSNQPSADSRSLTAVRLSIYDISGRLVKTLVDESQEPGVYQLPISNHQFPGSGIYFYPLQIPLPPLLKGEQKGDFTSTKKRSI